MKLSRLYGALIVPVLAAGIVTACSDSTSSNSGADAAAAPDSAAADTGTTPDTSTDAAPDASDDGSCAAYTGAIPNEAGALCHDLVNTAPALAIIPDNGTLPVGTGGTLGDGLYHMTEVRTYPGSPLPNITFKIAILIVGDTAYSVNDNSNEPTTERKITKRNPDGGAEIVVCTTKPTGSKIEETSSTATCNSLMTYDTNFKFSTKLTKQ